jgi:hypothetical protein
VLPGPPSVPATSCDYACVHTREETNNGDLGCDILAPLPWIDIFPRRMLTFFLGSERCPDTPQFSYIKDGFLHIDCPGEGSDYVIVKLLMHRLLNGCSLV